MNKKSLNKRIKQMKETRKKVAKYSGWLADNRLIMFRKGIV